MIPEWIDIGGVWKVLPPGIHDATLDEIEERFAYNDRRRELFKGFKKGLRFLKQAGCRTAYLNGSYVTDKEEPVDFDACWDPAGVNQSKLEPVLLNFDDDCRLQKEIFGGEFWVSVSDGAGSSIMLDFFTKDRKSVDTKGIICVQLDKELEI